MDGTFTVSSQSDHSPLWWHSAIWHSFYHVILPHCSHFIRGDGAVFNWVLFPAFDIDTFDDLKVICQMLRNIESHLLFNSVSHFALLFEELKLQAFAILMKLVRFHCEAPHTL